MHVVKLTLFFFVKSLLDAPCSKIYVVDSLFDSVLRPRERLRVVASHKGCEPPRHLWSHIRKKMASSVSSCIRP